MCTFQFFRKYAGAELCIYMYVIGLIKRSRHAFSSMVGRGSRSQGLRGDDIIIIILTSAVVSGSNYAR